MIGARLATLFEVDHSPSRIVPMEGMRGVAVSLVFMVHYVSLVAPWIDPAHAGWRWADAAHDLGNTGVDLFFVLSGYLIYGTLIVKARDLRRYAARRVERIYPTFLAVFALYLAIALVLPNPKIPATAAEAVPYLAANALLLPGLLPIDPLITVAWSLSYEMFYYLVIPALIGLLGLRAWRRRSRVLLFVALGVALLAAAPLLGERVRLAMFVAGILLYETLARGGTRPAPFAAVGALLAAFAFTQWLPTLGWPPVARFAALAGAFYLLCLAAFAGRSWLARALSFTPLRWLGNMSYSYYLIHGLALQAFFMVVARLVVPSGAQNWMLYAALGPAFAATLLASGVLFALVEKPWSFARPTAAPPPASAPNCEPGTTDRVA